MMDVHSLGLLKKFAGNHSGHDGECERCAVAALLSEREEWKHPSVVEDLEDELELWKGIAGSLMAHDTWRWVVSIATVRESAPGMEAKLVPDEKYSGDIRVDVTDRLAMAWDDPDREQGSGEVDIP